MTLSLDHECTIRTHHLPVPYALHDHHLIPTLWQEQLYGEVRIADSVLLCPTHDAHAKLACDAAVGRMVFGVETLFDRRQFGRELWGWAEDAALWLRERSATLPDDLEWRTAPIYSAGLLDYVHTA